MVRRGKGDKDRAVPLPGMARQAIAEQLRHESRLFDADCVPAPAVWCYPTA